MLKENAIVVELSKQFAVVEVIPTNHPCTQCQNGCGIASLAKTNKHVSKIKVINLVNAKLGDKVIIGLKEQALLKASLILYLLPLVSMFVIGIAMNTVLAAVLGFTIGILLVQKIVKNQMFNNVDYLPKIVKVY
ncbi:SoxR reducing system RseC family protein [Candidatus Marithrix sp. Canyon 246]|uniref:SoxR reducing system RseC family protein n=1 Tax=Candidatus Marithrix sp. Canyon 246 TaxID=1827136 RepID=UPI000849EDCC|nr:SoxR reducing system RseC family protein [Candidatus Marithrix sp. Canyon 246]